MKALMPLSFAFSLFFSDALAASISDLPLELLRDVLKIAGPLATKTFRLTSKGFMETIPPLSPVDNLLAACETGRFLLCQSEVDKLPSIEANLVSKAIQEGIPWAAVSLLDGSSFEKETYLEIFEEYLKTKGNHLVLLGKLLKNLVGDHTTREAAFLLACTYGNQYIVNKLLYDFVKDVENVAGHSQRAISSLRLAYLAAVNGRQEVIVGYFLGWELFASQHVGATEKLWIDDLIKRRRSDNHVPTLETVLAKCKKGGFLECLISLQKLPDHKNLPPGTLTQAVEDGNVWATEAIFWTSNPDFETAIKAAIKRNDHDILFILLHSANINRIVEIFLSLACESENQYAVFRLLEDTSTSSRSVKAQYVVRAYEIAVRMRNADMANYLQSWPFANIHLNRDSKVWLTEVTRPQW